MPEQRLDAPRAVIRSPCLTHRIPSLTFLPSGRLDCTGKRMGQQGRVGLVLALQ